MSQVGELLLFNSGHNIYADYRHLDNLSGEEEQLDELKPQGTQLHEQPHTIKHGDELPEVERLEYTYKPVLGDVPELNVPSMLPNLGNVASDVSWTAADLPSIAPSQARSPPRPTLARLVPRVWRPVRSSTSTPRARCRR